MRKALQPPVGMEFTQRALIGDRESDWLITGGVFESTHGELYVLTKMLRRRCKDARGGKPQRRVWHLSHLNDWALPPHE